VALPPLRVGNSLRRQKRQHKRASINARPDASQQEERGDELAMKKDSLRRRWSGVVMTTPTLRPLPGYVPSPSDGEWRPSPVVRFACERTSEIAERQELASTQAIASAVKHGAYERADERENAAPLSCQHGVKVNRESRYWPAWAAIAFWIDALTASRLKLAPGCMGGKSIAVCATFATSCWTNTKRQNSNANQL